MPQSDDPMDDSGPLETGTARLPPATPAPPTPETADEMTIPALSDEQIEERQRLLGTRRKPAGPPLVSPEAAQDEAFETPSDVPPTDVSEAIPADLSREGLDNEGPEPFESSERE